MRELPSGTVTFLFTDIEGSTKLLEELGAEAYSAALADHRRLLRDAFARHGGVEVDTQGDAFFIAFSDAAGAIATAGEAQRSLASGPIRVRMGLHTGTPHLGPEGYVGQDVHLGARIAAVGHGGQVLLSKQTREFVGHTLELTDLGEHRLKDFSDSVWIYQLGTERFPPLKTISNTNLPRPASFFVGREQEVSDIGALLRNGARLVTLSGPGGSGKTRLAIEAAAALVPEFRNGVFWVDLAPLREPALVRETIAHTLGAKDGLAEHIGERQMLLVLDNLEQVVEAAPELAALLSACPNLRLLVTSRELLRVSGEVEYAVPPLATTEAVELFCARSGLAPGDTIRELCRRLDNLPLAVELAAARTSVLSPAQILDRLATRLDLFKGGRDADPRQQTLRATIEWSYELLAAGEKELFVRLAVFRGGCTLEAAEEVADANLDTLQSLVDKSLLRHGGERFEMLETIREYAAERLAESAEADELRRRHAAYFAKLGETAAPELRGSSQKGWLERLERDHSNLRAALDLYLAGQEPLLGVQLAYSLFWFWDVRGHWREGMGWLQRALQSASLAPATDRARSVMAAGHLAFHVGEYARAGVLLDESIVLFRSLGLRRDLAEALLFAGVLLRRQSKLMAAERVHDESLALFTQTEDNWGMLFAHSELTRLARLMGKVERAKILANRFLAFARETGQDREIANALEDLAVVELGLEESQRAEQLLREALKLDRSIGMKQGEAACLVALGECAMFQGDDREAEARLEEGLAIYREIGDQSGVAFALVQLSTLALRRGDAQTAVSLLEEALSLFESNGEQLGIAVVLEHLATTCAAVGQQERAVQFFAAADAVRTQIGATPWPIERDRIEGDLRRLRDQLGSAVFGSAWQSGTEMHADEIRVAVLASHVPDQSATAKAGGARGPSQT